MKLFNRPSLRSGFTLMEVVITMGLFSMLIPAALLMSFQLLAGTCRGENRNTAIGDARKVQQFFTRKVNASGRYIRVQDDGNLLILELYNETTDDWEDAALAYQECTHSLLYFAPSTNSDYAAPITLSSSAFRVNDQAVFSDTNTFSQIRCNLYLGKQEPGSYEGDAARFINPGVFINIAAAPRNQGRYE